MKAVPAELRGTWRIPGVKPNPARVRAVPGKGQYAQWKALE
jgi:hypothetical protein